MDEELRRILAEQAAAIAEIKEDTKKIYRYLRWQRIGGWLKLLLILIPLIAGAIYLPPVLNDLINQVSAIH
ncbi:MAG TPA: hypothetical protein PKN62_00325 [bacterium]|nr:hypothetical protein [bacterium]